jgi:hypothetical protein
MVLFGNENFNVVCDAELPKMDNRLPVCPRIAVSSATKMAYACFPPELCAVPLPGIQAISKT